VSQGRHSLASRKSRAQRLTLLAAPLVTTAIVGGGIALADGPRSDTIDLSALTSQAASDIAARSAAISRSVERTALPKVTGKRWSTADLDLRLTPEDNASTTGEAKSLSRLAITGARRNGYVQVVVKQKTYWVTAEYLAAKKPADPAHLPILGKPCPDGSVEHGLTAGAIRVYRAVCNNFPQVAHYGGYDNHGEHRSGRALDIMTGDVSLGNAIAEFLRAHAAELNLYDVIWRQRIFTQERGGEGWRGMPSRGSATANHYDHVHVSVY
jgi:hypothetical protein